MIKTEFVNLYEKLSKLTEDSDYNPYEDEENEATLIPRISVTIIPKNKNDMPLLTKHIEDLCQDANSVNALETCVAGR
jgi:hypothetical protein